VLTYSDVQRRRRPRARGGALDAGVLVLAVEMELAPSDAMGLVLAMLAVRAVTLDAAV
jgi:hypothetical protein